MKTLSIVRHGKSDWSNYDLADYDRPLKARGFTDAYKMALRYKELGELPQVFYTSPANRALYTSIIFSRVLFNQFDNILIDEDLYLASTRTILNTVMRTPEEYNNIALFGHNPGVTSFANEFISDYIDNIPTSGFVKLEFDVSLWKEIHSGNLLNYNFDYPKRQI
ncbi:MAG: histidine phosphatase family protein [Bacteroidales bacterium]|nr:histidine phosphatase family protein [Bacteroidales bacterium]